MSKFEAMYVGSRRDGLEVSLIQSHDDGYLVTVGDGNSMRRVVAQADWIGDAYRLYNHAFDIS